MIKPPFDTEKELDLIKMMIDDKSVIPKVARIISPKDFYDENNLKNFIALSDDYKKTGEININNLALPISYLERSFVSSSWAIEYASTLRDLSARRSVLTALTSTSEMVEKWSADKLMNKVVESLSKIKSTKGGQKTLEQVNDNVLKDWEETKGKDLIGLDTGTSLNKLIKGYRESHYWVIGAYTNIGKTAFACYLTAKFIKEYPLKNIAYFSLEMTSEQTYERIMSQYLKTGIYSLRNNYDKYQDEINEIKKTGLTIYDNLRTVEEIRMELITLKSMSKLPRVVFIDFIQNMHADFKTEYERMSYITLELQNMAKDFSITIIVLSQVSNDGARADSPVLMPFKGSGTIAATADLGIMLTRNKAKELEGNLSLAELSVNVPKNRHGRAASFNMELDLSNGVISDSVTADGF